MKQKRIFLRTVGVVITMVLSVVACTNQMDDLVLSTDQDTQNVVSQDTEHSTDNYQYPLAELE